VPARCAIASACACAVAAMKAISASRMAHCIASLVAPSNVMPLMTVRMTTPRRMNSRMVSQSRPPGRPSLVKHGALSKSHVYQLLRSKDSLSDPNIGRSPLGPAPASGTQSHFQTRGGQFRGLVVPIPSGHQARLRHRRAKTNPLDNHPPRTLSGSVRRSKTRRSRTPQRRTIGLAFHRGGPKTSGADQRLSWSLGGNDGPRITWDILEPSI
jgi:hypothetical protein